MRVYTIFKMSDLLATVGKDLAEPALYCIAVFGQVCAHQETVVGKSGVLGGQGMLKSWHGVSSPSGCVEVPGVSGSHARWPWCNGVPITRAGRILGQIKEGDNGWLILVIHCCSKLLREGGQVF